MSDKEKVIDRILKAQELLTEAYRELMGSCEAAISLAEDESIYEKIKTEWQGILAIEDRLGDIRREL